MIPFFRKIRKQFADDNKPLKYMRYAIGEIVLVVIGILIALQVNNWNEERSNLERFENILKELRWDLETDIVNSEKIINDEEVIDSLSRLVLRQKISKKEYLEKGTRSLFWVGLQYTPFDYQKTAFKKIENFQGAVPKKYDSIVKNIYYYYNDLGQLHDDLYLSFREQIKDRHDYLANNTNWYYLMRSGKTNDEMIDFYLSNPIYKNWVVQHLVDNTAGEYGTIKEMQSMGFGLLISMAGKLDDSYEFKNKKISNKYGKPIDNVNELIGEYENLNTKKISYFTQINGYLYDDLSLLKEVKKDTFKSFDYPDWEIVFIKNTDGIVNGMKYIHLIDSTKNQHAAKIK